MRARLLAPLVLVLSLAACGGESDSSGGARSEDDSTAAAQPISTSVAKQALLTVEDLPDGWSVDMDEEDDANDRVTEGPKECAELFSDDEREDGDVKEEASFTQSDEGPFLAHQVNSWAGSGADKSFDEGVALIKKCPAFTTIDDDDFSVAWEVSEVDAPELGDRAVAYTIAAEAEGIPIQANLVAVQIDQSIVSIASTSIGDSMSDDLFADLAELAVERFEDAA